MIKMYFHVVYGGARRRYEGAGRNSQHNDVDLGRAVCE